MPCFDELFYNEEDGTEKASISYKGNVIIRYDKISIPNRCKIAIHLISTNSNWKQGIRLNVKGNFECPGDKLGKKLVIWEDAVGKNATLDVVSKDGLLGIYNAWDTGNGSVDAWHNGAAMMFEEIPNGRRYYCNDGHPDEDFDDLVFEIEVLPTPDQPSTSS